MLEATSAANEEDISRLFSGIATRRYAWTDEQGQGRQSIVIDVRLNHSDSEDLVFSFLFGTSSYDIDVLRHATVTSLATGEKQSADLIVGCSEESIPPVVYLCGELSCDEDANSAANVTDSAGLTVDTTQITFKAYCVTGETADTDAQVLARDFATPDPYADSFVSAFADQSHTPAEAVLPMAGSITFVDGNGETQTRKADLMFTPQDGAYIYSGAVYEDESAQSGYRCLGPDDGVDATITFTHYLVEDGRKIEAEDQYSLDAPRFIIGADRALPVLRCFDPTGITPDSGYETEYNRYALYFDQVGESYYVDADGDRGCVNPDRYGQYEAVGAHVDRSAPLAENPGPAPRPESPKYPITPEDGATQEDG